MGITTPIDAVPAIALGGLEEGVTPLEMASAYGTLANGGVHVPPHGIAEVTDADGKVLLHGQHDQDARRSRQRSPTSTTDILKGVIATGTGTAADIGRPAAGKTGHDAGVPRRLVRRLHAGARRRGLGGLPGRADRDDQRPRHAR